ncbi:MAG: hypothetical protein J3K34DRAFT_405884, partial [Monoraphidium minutum]
MFLPPTVLVSLAGAPSVSRPFRVATEAARLAPLPQALAHKPRACGACCGGPATAFYGARCHGGVRVRACTEGAALCIAGADSSAPGGRRMTTPPDPKLCTAPAALRVARPTHLASPPAQRVAGLGVRPGCGGGSPCGAAASVNSNGYCVPQGRARLPAEPAAAAASMYQAS